MTCTTHHICDCLKERMEKLEAVVNAVRELRLLETSGGNLNSRMEACSRLLETLEELEKK